MGKKKLYTKATPSDTVSPGMINPDDELVSLLYTEKYTEAWDDPLTTGLPAALARIWAVDRVALMVPLRRRVANRRCPRIWVYSNGLAWYISMTCASVYVL